MERFPRTPFLLSVFGAVFLGSRCCLAQAEEGAFCPVSEKEVAARFAWPDQLEAVNTFLSLGDREKEKRFKLEEEAEDEDEGEASGGFENVEEEFYSLLSDPFQSKCQVID